MEDNTLMAENEEEIKCLLMRVKEENEKASMKLNIKKTKIMAFSPIILWQIEGVKSSNKCCFLGHQNHWGQ